jgi:SAM-dependent methyltransferase
VVGSVYYVFFEASMARHDTLYSRAYYYDIALERNVEREADFLIDAHAQHGTSELRSVLEIGCGPGYHSIALAARGIDAYGLDISEEMLAIARIRAQTSGVDVTWIQGDMRDVPIDGQVDMAICLFDGIDALLTDADFERHFLAIAACVREGGLYIIDCTHPRDCSLASYGDYRYEGSRDGVHVEIEWGINRPAIDPVTGIAEVATRMIIRENGHEAIIEDAASERCLTGQELKLLAERCGHFTTAEWYGTYNIAQTLDNSPSSDRMILVLRKSTHLS